LETLIKVIKQARERPSVRPARTGKPARSRDSVSRDGNSGTIELGLVITLAPG